MSKGWIKLHRQIMDHPFYSESRVFSRHEAWEYLLLNANHSDNKVLIDGQLIDVERGSFITSIRKLQERWKWSNTKVCRFLDVLESEGMATRKNDSKKTLITIDKYGFYQGEEDEETTEKRHENDGETTQKHTNKNVKNLKNVKNDKDSKDISAEIFNFRSIYSPELLEIIDSYLEFIRETRKGKQIADTIVHKIMLYFSKYSSAQVEYAIRTHMNNESKRSAKEEYTFGIVRKTSELEAQQKLLTGMTRKISTNQFDSEAFLANLKEE
ncbi:Replication protein O [Cohnella silvisoli]|uniref:Replication protein O n=1 Tax=Cohnella silvisoli TaxID=2873699 RepID=A0ABV1L2X1_9BACL|nr:Replication protein O [Cohnella silvisoli]MCD9026024.1 Replication protein O [Cohnella silvisoli]